MRLRAVADRNIPGLREALESTFTGPPGPSIDLRVMPASAIDAAAVREADLLFVRSTVRCGAPLLEGSAVRFLATATIGTDHLDIPWLEARGVRWASAPGSNADSVVQWLAAALCERAPGLLGAALLGQRPVAGVVGVGNVGSRAQRLLEALGFEVLLCDPPRGLPLPLDELCQRSALLTLHVPLTRPGQSAHPTLGLFDAERLGGLRPGVVLVNASRGEVLDGDAARQARQEGRVGALLLDVFPGEPTPDPALVAAADVATPHIAGHALEGKVNGTRMVYEAACRFLGVTPTWTPGPPLLPPNPLDGAALSPGAPPVVQLREVLQRSYDLAVDDGALRALVHLPADLRGAAFRRYRDGYPVRRQLTGARLHGAHPQLRAVLEALGATV